MANKEMKSIKFSSTSEDTYYVVDETARQGLIAKQDTLVSGTNIKTINNQSLLGSGNITIQGGGGGSSAMTVFTNSEISYQNMSWNQVLEKAFDTVSISGIYFGSSMVSDLLYSGTGTWTIGNSDISIVVDGSTSTVTVNVGSTSINVCYNGTWDDKNYRSIQDDSLQTKVVYSTDDTSKPSYIELNFRDKDNENPVSILCDSTTGSSIKNLSSSVYLIKDNTQTTVNQILKAAEIKCKSVTFDSTYSNNYNNTLSSESTIYSLGNYKVDIQANQAMCTNNGSSNTFYDSGWYSTQELYNGCNWNADTYTLTFPQAFELYVEYQPIQNVTENVTFSIQFGGDINIPAASGYTNQIAEIKDTIEGVDLMIYSNGSKWIFASDVLQLSQSQYDNIPATKTLYGIDITNKWFMNPYDGLPVRIPTNSSGWSSNYSFQQMHYSQTISNNIYSFTDYNYVVTDENSNMTINVASDIYSTHIFIDATDYAPTITWQGTNVFVFKQDGTEQSGGLQFNKGNFYKLTINGANFNNNYVTFIDCETYTVPV